MIPFYNYKSILLCTIMVCQVTTAIAQYNRIIWNELSSIDKHNTLPHASGTFMWSYLGYASANPYLTEDRVDQLAFGLDLPRDGSGLFLNTFGKDLVGAGGGQNSLVTPLDAGVVIGPSSNWTEPFARPIIASSGFTEWHGKSGYIGLQVSHKNQIHYGWIKIRVSENGRQVTLEESAVHGAPNEPITTGDRGELPVPNAITQSSSFLCIGITNMGRLGFIGAELDIDRDALTCRSEEANRGVGFRYKENALFYEAGLILAVDENRVLSTVRGNSYLYYQDMDLNQRPGSVMEVTRKGQEIMYGRVELTDEHAAHPIGVSILQESFTYSQSIDNGDFVILRYTIKNESQQPINGLFAGLWVDWDLGTDIKKNTGLHDLGRNLGYVQSNANPQAIAGVRVLSEHPYIGFHNASVEDDTGVDQPNSTRNREDKWKILSGQTRARNTLISRDIIQISSVGPMNISPGDEAEVLFALVTGDGREDLLANSDRALAAVPTAILVASEPASPVPSSIISIDQVYPNPTMNQATLTFQLPNSAHVEIDVYDLIGRHVHRLLTGHMPSGLNEVTWNINHASMSSGVYAIRWSVNHGAHKESQFVVVR